MRIVTFQRRSNSTRGGLLLPNNRILDLGLAYSRLLQSQKIGSDDTAAIIDSLRGLSSSILEILRAGDEAVTNCFELEKAALAGNLEDLLYSMGDTPLVAPIPVPPLLLHFDAYERHARAVQNMLGSASSDLAEAWYLYPVHYVGNPHTVTGPDVPVMFPEGETQMDWELEFAAVLAEDVRDATIEEAEDAILGYTIVNDWTARYLQADLQKAGLGPSKSKTFCTSMGPYIVTKDEIARPGDLKMVARVNGKEVATARSGDARYSLAEMISYASEGTVLPAGTVVTAGAAASGLEVGTYLKAGDVVELEVENIGVLRNKVWERQHGHVYTPRVEG